MVQRDHRLEKAFGYRPYLIRHRLFQEIYPYTGN